MSLRANEYYKPKTLQDAYSKLKEDPKNTILAGGLWMKKTGLQYNYLIDLCDLELNYIKEEKDVIRIGAMTSLRDFENSPIINKLNGGVAAFGAREVMGPAFRNSATIGGSIYGRYPFSDVITSLLTLDVTLCFYPEKTISLEEYLNYKGKVDGILKEIDIKKEDGKAFFKKVKTTALDFPLINFSIVKRNNKHYIAVGSRPMVAALAHKAMEAVDSGASYEEAANIAVEELQYMDSFNISKEYRMDLARIYIRRGLEEVNK